MCGGIARWKQGERRRRRGEAGAREKERDREVTCRQ